MIRIRPATVDDVEVFHQLVLAEARHHNAEQNVHTDVAELRRAGFGDSPKFGVLLAEFDGEVAGYASYTFNYSIWLGADFLKIDDVFVSEAHRGKKIGEALMLGVRELATEAGLRRIRWEVQSANHAAIRFYERLGAVLTPKGIFSWSI